MSRVPLPLAVLISGGGTTLRNLIAEQQADRLPVRFVQVISSRPDARGLDYAREAGIPHQVIDPRNCDGPEQFSEAVFSACRDAGSQLVVMGGFLKHVLIPADFENRVINIHPGLIPAFCGQGFYGSRVHRAVLDYGAKVSGCTVHFVDDDYDHGPIILQQTVPVHDDDSPAQLAARVFEQECIALPQAIRLFAAGKLQVDGRRVRVLD